ncbi:hypothetical protein L7F22_050667 [Adiantum nelumboides]|nr:hypothetical protein [Adiantum nelumboides]
MAYQLKLPKHWLIHNAFHVSLLKSYKGEPPKEAITEDPPEVEGQEEVLQPESVLRHEDKVSKLVLVNAQGYAKGTGRKANFPKFMAYAGVGRLHCLMPGWAKASVDFMLSGGYNVASRISKIRKETLVIWVEENRIISKDSFNHHSFQRGLTVFRVVFMSNSGHLPHVEDPEAVATLISDFCQS